MERETEIYITHQPGSISAIYWFKESGPHDLFHLYSELPKSEQQCAITKVESFTVEFEWFYSKYDGSTPIYDNYYGWTLPFSGRQSNLILLSTEGIKLGSYFTRLHIIETET